MGGRELFPMKSTEMVVAEAAEPKVKAAAVTS